MSLSQSTSGCTGPWTSSYTWLLPQIVVRAARVADDVERRSEEDLVQIDAVENCSVGAGARPGHEHFARIDEVLTSEFLDDLRVVPAVMRHTARELVAGLVVAPMDVRAAVCDEHRAPVAERIRR